ncbi:MAG: T9SS type A sorting domain-containing protein [Prolixibacteraceae bacterium]
MKIIISIVIILLSSHIIYSQDYIPNDNSLLSAIMWPDIPEKYRGTNGWKGDTIPHFTSSTFNYRLEIPNDIKNIPALVAKTKDINATVEVKRAKNLIYGTVEDRTISFIVTAENGIDTRTYNVELLPEGVQYQYPEQSISTVSSSVYLVSPGYSHEEKIYGIVAGTTVAGFMENIVKNNENQSLKVISSKDGSVLPPDAVLSWADTLMVISADTSNTTKYFLEIAETHWFPAILVSDVYPVWIDTEPKTGEEKNKPGRGTLTGMEYGTMLKTVLSHVWTSGGEILNVINSKGAYVPLRQLNFDTTYVHTTVHPDIFLEVIDERKLTSIIYQIKPESSPEDAFIVSDVYGVNQKQYRVEFVPGGTTVATFLRNVVPVMGATVQIVDSSGNPKTSGPLHPNDKVIVTSADGNTQVEYTFNMLTNAGSVAKKQNQVSIYPNPTSGEITINGIQPAGIIQIHDSSGILLLDKKIAGPSDVISLKNFSPGYYIISFHCKTGSTQTVKIIKK